VSEETLTVANLTRGVARAIARAFPDDLWVEGEIRDLTRSNRGHVYFSLVDPVAAGDETAIAYRLPVTLFASDRRVVNRALMAADAPRMTDGVRVRVRGSLSLYGPRATLQLRMTSVDTEYTVGAYAAERARILAALNAEGLLERNRALPVPHVPLRIGLVTSAGSAAEADFVAELQASGFGFVVIAVDARVQGVAAAASLTKAISVAVAADVELIALVRGGGSQSDLVAFDDEAVARAVAGASVPIFTGIGHEIDEAIADRVAAATFKTPTACAAAIVSRVAAFAERLEMLQSRISVGARSRVDRRESRLADMSGRVHAAARIRIYRSSGRLERSQDRLQAAAATSVTRAERRVTATGERLRRTAPRRIDESVRLLAARAGVLAAHDPQRALARGWTILRDGDGRLVRTVSGLTVGDTMQATLRDGEVVGRVETIEPRTNAKPRGDAAND
jgi:exodeoxyribonuclease VII large subunit